MLPVHPGARLCLAVVLALAASGCSTFGRRDPDSAAFSLPFTKQATETQSEASPTHAADSTKSPGAIVSKKDAAQACLAVARSLDAEGHHAEAVSQYELARSHDPRLPNVSRRLAVLNARLGNADKAKAEFDTCLRATPRDADLLSDVGYFHLRQGDAAKAEEHLRQAVSINPKLDKAWVNLGLALAEQNRREESLEAFCKAVSPAVARANLGVVLLRKGNRDEAEATLRQTVALDPTLREAKMALQYLDSAAPSLEAPRTTLASE